MMLLISAALVPFSFAREEVQALSLGIVTIGLLVLMIVTLALVA